MNVHGSNPTACSNLNKQKCFFECLPADVRAEMHTRLIKHHYKRKQVIFHENIPANGIYLIHSGIVKIYKSDALGKEYILQLQGSGDVLGLEDVVLDAGHCTTAEMVVDGMVSFLDRQTIMSLLNSQHSFVLHVLRLLSCQISQGHQRRLELANEPVRKRLAKFLLLMAQSYGVVDQTHAHVDLVLSREEIADMIGSVTETTIRSIKELKDQNVIELHGKHFEILDLKRLEVIAGLHF